MNFEWTFVLFTHFGVTSGITQGFRVIPEVTPKWVNNSNVHSKFTLISLFSKIHSLKSEHIHSFLFREYRIVTYQTLFYSNFEMYYFSTYVTFSSEFQCNGVLKCVSLTHQKWFLGGDTFQNNSYLQCLFFSISMHLHITLSRKSHAWRSYRENPPGM